MTSSIEFLGVKISDCFKSSVEVTLLLENEIQLCYLAPIQVYFHISGRPHDISEQFNWRFFWLLVVLAAKAKPGMIDSNTADLNSNFRVCVW